MQSVPNALSSRNPNLGGGPSSGAHQPVVKASAEHQSRLQIVQQVCDAIDAEATESVTSQHVKQELEKSVGEELSWPEYRMRLQSLGFNAGLTPGLASHNKFNTPMIFKGGLMTSVTPKTIRLPKPGETMLSINGSPLGQSGKTPATAGGTTRITRAKSRLASSKRCLRDL